MFADVFGTLVQYKFGGKRINPGLFQNVSCKGESVKQQHLNWKSPEGMAPVSPEEHVNCCGESELSFHSPWHLLFNNLLKFIWLVSFFTSCSGGMHAGECIIRPMREETNRPNNAAGTMGAIRKFKAKWANCIVSADICIWECLIQQVGTSIKVQGTDRDIWSEMVSNWRSGEQGQAYIEAFKGVKTREAGVRESKAKYPRLDQHSGG